MSTTATYPQRSEPIFSTRQSDTESGGQVVSVLCYFPDGSSDFEEERVADFGIWLPAEDVTACEERLTRKLRRRNAAKFGESPQKENP